MKKISLIKKNCKRCNKELMTSMESLWGLDKEKQAFGIVCRSCVVREEEMKIHEVIGNGILEKVTK